MITIIWKCDKCDFSYKEKIEGIDFKDDLYPSDFDNCGLFFCGDRDDGLCNKTFCKKHYKKWQKEQRKKYPNAIAIA